MSLIMNNDDYDSTSSEELEPNIPVININNPYISQYKEQDIEDNSECKSKIKVKFCKNDRRKVN